MPRKRSRSRRTFDEESSDDDESLILAAAQIVGNFSNEKGRHGGSVKGHKFFTVIDKADMTCCIKIIWRRIQHTASKYSVEGYCPFNIE